MLSPFDSFGKLVCHVFQRRDSAEYFDYSPSHLLDMYNECRWTCIRSYLVRGSYDVYHYRTRRMLYDLEVIQGYLFFSLPLSFQIC